MKIIIKKTLIKAINFKPHIIMGLVGVLRCNEIYFYKHYDHKIVFKSVYFNNMHKKNRL